MNNVPLLAGNPPATTGLSRGGADAGQHLIFTLTGEPFAIGILHVREIIEYGTVTEVPMMPEVVRGVINLRGSVVPVIDLAARFSRGRTQVQRRTCVVVVEVVSGDADKQAVGILVDSVNEVQDIAADQIEPPPSFGARLRTDFIAGMCKLANRFVIMLDVRRVLSMEDIEALSAVAAPSAQLDTAPPLRQLTAA
jgi:purine-binding chemotaxis protein CheW